MNWDDTYNRIVDDEGFRTDIYLDPLSKTKDYPNGIPTIGPGIALFPGTELPIQAITAMASGKFRACIEDYHRFESTYNLELDSIRRSVITEMIWNIGLGGVCKFHRMIAAMQRDDWQQAGVEIIDSKVHRKLYAERERQIRLRKLTWWPIRTEVWAGMMMDGEGL